MKQHEYRILRGDPADLPFKQTLVTRLARELPLGNSFAEFKCESIMDAHHIAAQVWQFNAKSDLEWKFATRTLKQPDGRAVFLRVWKTPTEYKGDHNGES